MYGWASFKTSYDIDTFATALLHEFVHYTVYSNFWYGKSDGYIIQNDKDKDGLLDSAEPGMGFDPTMVQTYMTNHPELKNVQYDEEWLAYEAMKDYTFGTYDKLDWSVPGAQWPNL